MIAPVRPLMGLAAASRTCCRRSSSSEEGAETASASGADATEGPSSSPPICSFACAQPHTMHMRLCCNSQLWHRHISPLSSAKLSR